MVLGIRGYGSKEGESTAAAFRRGGHFGTLGQLASRLLQSKLTFMGHD